MQIVQVDPTSIDIGSNGPALPPAMCGDKGQIKGKLTCATVKGCHKEIQNKEISYILELAVIEKKRFASALHN